MARIAQIDGGAAGHVVLHPLHAVGRLDRDAAGVEGDALADQAEHRARPARRRARVPHHDHARRLGAAARDAEQQAHAEPRDRVLVEDLDVEPGTRRESRRRVRRRPTASARSTARCDSSRAMLHDSPRIRPRSTARSSAADRASRSRRSASARERARTVAALVAIAAECRQHQPFRDSLNVQLTIAGRAINEGDPGDPALAS